MDIKEQITGIQHIGLPTADVDKTIAFYKLFGFEVTWERKDPAESRVAFLQNKNCVIETYYAASPAMADGAIDHISLDVQDIEATYAFVTGLGFKDLAGEITYLPFFEKGVRFFTILGPNHEKVEFNQIL